MLRQTFVKVILLFLAETGDGRGKRSVCDREKEKRRQNVHVHMHVSMCKDLEA